MKLSNDAKAIVASNLAVASVGMELLKLLKDHLKIDEPDYKKIEEPLRAAILRYSTMLGYAEDPEYKLKKKHD